MSVEVDQIGPRRQLRETVVTPVRWLLRQEAGGILLALVLLCAGISVAAPNFLGSYNLLVVARQASFVGLLALGQTLVLLLGGIDLSVGASAGLSAIIGALILTRFATPPAVALLLTVGFGFVLGLANGFFVAVMKLNPFIVTLAAWEMFAGATLVITHGYPVQPLGEAFHQYGGGTVWGVPMPVVFFLLIAALLAWMLNFSRFGRNIYAVGGNREAAKLVGIPVERVEALVYGLAGALAALGGILYASRMDSAEPAVGEDWLMGAITASIIGGTSLRGGQGTILGAVLGTLLMAVLSNGMALLNVSGYWARVVVGAVVLVAVLVDLLRRR
jgi:ribose transport system permease protein